MTASPDAFPKPVTGQPPVSILMYHQVGEFPRPDSHRGSYCHVKRFKAQMAWLKRMGFDVISLQAAYEALFGSRQLRRRSVVLTFDDGYRNFFDHALPALERHGFPATVFMISGLVGGRAQWVARDGREAPPMMDAAMLRELLARGVTVGSHTVSHSRLAHLPESQARTEIRDSKAALEDTLGRQVAHFCYPFGNYNPAARDVVAEAGYLTGLSCIRGDANYAYNAFEIPRKGISYGDSLAGYFWKLQIKHRLKDNKPAEAR
jgi:peptidoglycan/xylan/chitin deacetylase (PgdA/CDA1 family)